MMTPGDFRPLLVIVALSGAALFAAQLLVELLPHLAIILRFGLPPL